MFIYNLCLGPFWRNPVMDCKTENYSSSFCYKLIQKSNWFDAIDNCKLLGGNILSIDNVGEEKFIATKFSNVSSLWLGYHFGTARERLTFSWNNHTNVSHGRMEEMKLKEQLSNGLCLALNEGNWTRQSCSNVANTVCKVPGKRKSESVMVKMEGEEGR